MAPFQKKPTPHLTNISTPATAEPTPEPETTPEDIETPEPEATTPEPEVEPAAYSVEDLKASGGTDWEKRPQRVVARPAAPGEVINGKRAKDGQYVVAIQGQVDLIDSGKFLAMYGPVYVAPVEGPFVIQALDLNKIPEQFKKDGVLDKNEAMAYCVAQKAAGAKVIIPGCGIGERAQR